MISRKFIFSEAKSDRIKRHVFFWSCYWMYFSFLHAANSGGNPQLNYFRNIPFATIEAFFLLVPQLLFTYSLLYFVLPRYLLKNRYLISFLWILLLVACTAVIIMVSLTRYAPVLMETILPKKFIVRNPRTVGSNFWLAMIVSFKGNMQIAAIACSIKLVKYWHLKEKRNLELLKEKTEAQLQLLTAQVHPHFLFNTLNNIYSKAQNESPGSAKMIMELSHILRYVLDEGKHELVPLENELQMLTDYINLEKMRYDDKLDLHLSLPAKTENIYISPLLLLPFVENCFKHGTSKMINNPWINLKIELQGTSLIMKLMNGKKESLDTQNGRVGTGIENVKKRLGLLYKDKYDLQINSDDEVFVVNLMLELVAIASLKSVHLSENPRMQYA
jgi:sensor histidine kinase YesM